MWTGALPHDCKVCSVDSVVGRSARAQWGCDKDTAHAQFSCADTGIELHSCPRKFMASSREANEIFAYWATHFTGGKNRLPAAGGLLDQAATFVEAVTILDCWEAEQQASRIEKQEA